MPPLYAVFGCHLARVGIPNPFPRYLVNYLGANVLIPLSRIGLDTTIIMGSILVIVLALVVLGAIAALVASIQSYLRARRIARGEVVAEEEEFVPSEGGCCGNHL